MRQNHEESITADRYACSHTTADRLQHPKGRSRFSGTGTEHRESGRQQTREEYFADIADGSLNYFTIGIADPVIKVDGDKAQITYTSVLNANAYGARGTYRMKGTHYYELRDDSWIAVGK